MVRATSTQIYNPPALPDYLKDVYNLKPIVGAPNDDEVKGIHAVIRVAQLPGMFDLPLSTSLAQHLFEVQMARYRDRYPCGAFPGDMVHTPPTLPALPLRVPITLEPVTGSPSDEEIQNVYHAVLTYEGLAIHPSIFDPNVGMELSQHLFNLHFARYMSQASQGELGSKSRSPQKGGTRSSAQTRQPIDRGQDQSDEEPTRAPQESIDDESAQSDDPSPPAAPVVDDTPLAVACESKQVLRELVDTMKDIKRVMITTQQSRTRGARGSHYKKGDGAGMIAQELMNDEGELPRSLRLPAVGADGWPNDYQSTLTETQLARYLQFYGICPNLVTDEEIPGIKDGHRVAAETLLSNYLNW